MIISFVVNLINCAGTIRFTYSFPNKYKDVKINSIENRIKIAFFDNGQNINIINKDELEYLKNEFQNHNIPFYIEKNRNMFNNYDLIIINYSISYPSGFEKGMINTMVFISYLQMFITLGVLHSVDFNYKYHQIDVYNPKSQNEATISFTERIQKEDGWAPFLFGKFNGKFIEKHKRYLVFENSQEFYENVIVKRLIPEAN